MSTLVVNTKFDELCRLCGSKTDSLAVHIFEDEGTFSELENKILGCLQIQINQQDELPKQLCDHCLVKLEMFWDFKDRSLRTEQLLIELLKQLKNAEDAQCFVSVDPEGMVLQESIPLNILASFPNGWRSVNSSVVVRIDSSPSNRNTFESSHKRMHGTRA
ncbi:hypothetical protein HUJ04_008305 [Dendroctonus ponderosae]|nr:hypothetical protein HUJ04_008305 [Dendroctonus ponderosae]